MMYLFIRLLNGDYPLKKKSRPVSESESSSLGFCFLGLKGEEKKHNSTILDIVGILCVWRGCVINPN